MWVNVAGCAAIGVFMVLTSEARAVHRLVRPCAGVGVLGGFTTFSAYSADIQQLVHGGRVPAGLAYPAVTPLTALAAVGGAVRMTRRLLAWRAR